MHKHEFGMSGVSSCSPETVVCKEAEKYIRGTLGDYLLFIPITLLVHNDDLVFVGFLPGFLREERHCRSGTHQMDCTPTRPLLRAVSIGGPDRPSTTRTVALDNDGPKSHGNTIYDVLSFWL